MDRITTDQILAGYPNEKIKYIKQHPYVGEDGIYTPINEYASENLASVYKMLIPKEVFIEAYNKWIKGND